MATDIVMPKLSDTMTEGQLGEWRKNVGDRIERGDVIAEVETDKATMDLEAFTSGILLEQRVPAGEMVPVGTVIGRIGASGENAAPQKPVPVAAPSSSAPQPSQPDTPPEIPSASAPEEPAPPAAIQTAPVRGHEAAPGIQAAPVVRRRAAELGIDLGTVQGSGPYGRIMLEDLEQGTHAGPAGQSTAATLDSAAPTAIPPQPVSRMRSAIARTTTAAWQTIPHFYLSRDIEMDRAEEVIRTLKAEGVPVSLNAMIMAAAASALAGFPRLIPAFNGENSGNPPHVNLSFAVALDDGLQMPVIREADLLGVRDLTAAVARLVEGAKHGTLSSAELTGGNFGISNLGMYGVDSLVSIIMPGQTGILGIGSISDRAVVHDGQLAVARVMTVTLSCDHRLMDGATAAGFLNVFKKLLEYPAGLPA